MSLSKKRKNKWVIIRNLELSKQYISKKDLMSFNDTKFYKYFILLRSRRNELAELFQNQDYEGNVVLKNPAVLIH